MSAGDELPSVLVRIVARKRAELAGRKARRPLATFAPELPRSDRDFRAALSRPRTGLICECKCASPSAGRLRPDREYDPAALAIGYAGVADAISVLVDEVDFGGHLEHLRAVRAAVSCPVLCKEFVVDPYQVYEAREAGADAILLMLSVLGDEVWRECHDAAQSLDMDTLTEVASDREMLRAVALDAPIIGVNNRDLHTLTIDLARGEAMLPILPPECVAVAESGFHTHADLLRYGGLADAFLVGTALAGADQPGHAARELVTGAVKVCGLTRPEDAQAAWDAGAAYGGVILAPSPRKVDVAQAARVFDAAPLRRVAVTVDAAVDELVRLAETLRLDALQLHGDEPPGKVEALRAVLPVRCEIWKARRVTSAAEVDPADPALRAGADRLLLDTRAGDARGGTGQAFDWAGLEQLDIRDRLVLAGGVGPANAAEAARLGCSAIDVNSQVELSPGVKDPAALDALFAALRGFGRSAQETLA